MRVDGAAVVGDRGSVVWDEEGVSGTLHFGAGVVEGFGMCVFVVCSTSNNVLSRHVQRAIGKGEKYGTRCSPALCPVVR